MWRQGSFRSRSGHDAGCRCGHERVCHYTKEGGCVYQACDCTEFRPKGRQEYATAKRGRCDLGHSHDSGLEIRTCCELQIRARAHDIASFRFHPVIDLPGPSGAIVARYEVDFEVLHNDGATEYIECKGDHLIREMGWRIKWSLIQDKHKGDPKFRFQIITG